MDRKAVSPVIAIVLLLMMTVAAAGAAYFWLTSMQSSMQESSRKSIENIMEATGRRVVAQAAICKSFGITNWDFSEGWTNWSHNAVDHWMNGSPADGSCQTPPNDGNGICSYPADTVTILSSSNGDAECSPGSGCPTPVLGDGDLNLNGNNDGGYEGNIYSDSFEVPSESPYLHFWVNLQGRSSDGGKYDGNNRFWGTPSNYTATEGEGVYWAVFNDNGCDGIDGDDTLIDMEICGGDECLGGSGTSNPSIKGEKTVNLSSYSGECIYLYLQQMNAGGGDDGLIQVDDLYFSSRVKVTVRNIGSVEIPEAKFVANLKKDGTTVDSDTYVTESSIDTGDLKTLTFYFNEMRPDGEYNINIPGIDVSQTVKCQSLES